MLHEPLGVTISNAVNYVILYVKSVDAKRVAKMQVRPNISQLSSGWWEPHRKHRNVPPKTCFYISMNLSESSIDMHS